MKRNLAFCITMLIILAALGGCKGGNGKCKDDCSPTTPPVCTISVDIASHTFGCDGGSLRVRLLTPTGCTISGQVTSDQGWLSVSQSSNEFTAVAPRNESGAQRTANISINGVRVATYTQNACSTPVNCVYTASPSSFSFDYQGRSGTITVLKSPASCLDCTTVPSGLPAWITIVYSGNGVFTYTVTTNTDTNNSREVTFTLCGSTVTIRQGPAPRQSCSFTVTPSTTNFSCPGGTAMFNVVTQSGCSWFAETNSSWITITSGGSWINGSGVAAISVSQNGTSSRSGTITVAGQSFTVTQNACDGGGGPITYTATGSCTRTATATRTCPNGSTVTGSGSETRQETRTSTFSQSDAQSRADAAACASAQAAAQAEADAAAQAALASCQTTPTCTYLVGNNQTTWNIPRSGASFGISVETTPDTCQWTAVSHNLFVRIMSSATNTGDGEVNMKFDPNNTGGVLTGTATIAGRTLTFIQSN